jgi:hypothetical protein
MNPETDLCGARLTEVERELLEVFARLKALSARTDAAPCVVSNARFALAAVFQACNDLGILFEPTDDVGV